MNTPKWTAPGLTARAVSEHRRDFGLVLVGQAALSPELVRLLRDWLTWWLDDDGATPPPADPDAVRLAIDEQRAALRERSTADVGEDFRAGLAWADHALDMIAKAAGS